MAKKEFFLDNITSQVVVTYLKRHRYLTAAMISWVVMGVLTVVFLIPQIGLVAQHRSDVAAQQKKFDDTKAAVSFLQGLNADTLHTQATTVQSVLPQTKPVIPLLSSMEQLAAQAGISLNSLTLNPGKVSTGSADPSSAQKSTIDGVYSLPMRLEVQGQFLPMHTFFKSLDQLVPLINIKTIEFTALNQASSVNQNSQYKAIVDLESLYVLPSSPSHTPTVQVPTLTPLNQLSLNLIASLSAMVANQPQPIIGASSSAGLARPDVFSY
ncbi:hypothetical protein C5B42_04900 [Candidatus Cerribacteria bacterium 'Amazon FNV 2010 28 9']|uniref:Uncharacterized protein n=1 Tax=Candidatus Cerribacteria bacterium 'Amazon FNV 2010 28 9' TaxID=2081795 RepID=A0A317JRX1_9BACT|nr:MAG: hypothetical protein C5B42_04900 [Candidatus Cerribacteria bacterium 'Amazon FNV 2010 28 9']